MTAPVRLRAGLRRAAARRPVGAVSRPDGRSVPGGSVRRPDRRGAGSGLAHRRPGDSRLIARRLCANRRILVASPSYLKKRGVPKVPTDIAEHECILFMGQTRPREWNLRGPEGALSVPVAGRLVSNNIEVLARAAKDGLGITLGATLAIGPALLSGELVRVLRLRVRAHRDLRRLSVGATAVDEGPCGGRLLQREPARSAAVGHAPRWPRAWIWARDACRAGGTPVEAATARGRRKLAGEWKQDLRCGCAIWWSASARQTAVDHVTLTVERRRAVPAARAERLRQDDAAAQPRRVLPRRRRADSFRRRGRDALAAAHAQRGHGVPELRAVAAPDRGRERRLRPARAQESRGARSRRRVEAALASMQHGRLRRAAASTSCRAASSSAWRSRARWSSGRAACCSTSRCRTWTRGCATRCATRSAASARSSG